MDSNISRAKYWSPNLSQFWKLEQQVCPYYNPFSSLAIFKLPHFPFVEYCSTFMKPLPLVVLWSSHKCYWSLKIECSKKALVIYECKKILFASLNSILLISFRQLLMTQMEHHKIPYHLTEVVLLQMQLPQSHRISLQLPSYLLTFHRQWIHRRQMHSLYLRVPNLLPRQWWGRQCSYIKLCPINSQDRQ